MAPKSLDDWNWNIGNTGYQQLPRQRAPLGPRDTARTTQSMAPETQEQQNAREDENVRAQTSSGVRRPPFPSTGFGRLPQRPTDRDRSCSPLRTGSQGPDRTFSHLQNPTQSRQSTSQETGFPNADSVRRMSVEFCRMQEQLRAEVNRERRRTHQADADRNDLKTKLDVSEGQLKTPEAEANSLKATNQSLQNNLTEVTERQQALEKERDQYKAKFDSLDQKLEETQQALLKREPVEERLKTVESEIDQFKVTVATFSKERQGPSESLISIKAQNESLKHDHERSQEENSRLHTELAEVTKAYQDLREKHSKAEEDVETAELRGEARGLRQALEHSQAEHNRMQQLVSRPQRGTMEARLGIRDVYLRGKCYLQRAEQETAIVDSQLALQFAEEEYRQILRKFQRTADAEVAQISLVRTIFNNIRHNFEGEEISDDARTFVLEQVEAQLQGQIPTESPGIVNIILGTPLRLFAQDQTQQRQAHRMNNGSRLVQLSNDADATLVDSATILGKSSGQGETYQGWDFKCWRTVNYERIWNIIWAIYTDEEREMDKKSMHLARLAHMRQQAEISRDRMHKFSTQRMKAFLATLKELRDCSDLGTFRHRYRLMLSRAAELGKEFWNDIMELAEIYEERWKVIWDDMQDLSRPFSTRTPPWYPHLMADPTLLHIESDIWNLALDRDQQRDWRDDIEMISLGDVSVEDNTAGAVGDSNVGDRNGEKVDDKHVERR
ncbi:MAG: hypothetical protein Q9160_001405 [Pyrenula sp. 1 TL-2023]